MKHLLKSEFLDLIPGSFNGLNIRFFNFRYFTRFDDEMEQIDLKRQINSKRGNQHASRESIIKMNLEQETKNFAAGGIELPDLCDPVAFKKFKEWNGNSHSIQHLDVRFISRRYLNELKPTVGLK